MGKRKYPEVKGYWVYSILVHSVGKYYVGVSNQQCCRRWHKSMYKDMALEPYLDEWDSMVKTVLIDGLTKEEALKLEDALIQDLHLKDLCINSKRSGLITNDINAYMRELKKTNPDYREHQNQQKKKQQNQRYETDVEYREQKKQRQKQYYEKNKEKVLERQRQRYNRKKLENQQNQLTLFDIVS